MSGLSLPKVSGLMTPKERAKLVIKLVQKGLLEMGPNPEDPLPTEREIKQVVAACPSSETKEYNFYIGLKEQLWKRLQPIIEFDLNYLEILDSRARMIRFLLTISPGVNNSLEIVRRHKDLGHLPEGEGKALLASEQEIVIGHLEGMSLFKLSEKDPETGVIRLQLSSPLIADALKHFVSEFGITVSCIHKNIAVAEKIEERHFDGMEVLLRDSKQVSGVIPRVLTKIDDIVEDHNKELIAVVDGFDLMSMGLSKHQFDGLEEFLLKSDYELDSAEVDRKVMAIENDVKR